MAKAKETPPAVPPEGLVGQGDDAGTPPKYGVAKPAESGGKVPRIIGERERAIAGTKRFKVRCNNYGSPSHKYVLAVDEASAVACFLEAHGITSERDRLKKSGKPSQEPDLVVRELPD